MQQYYLLSQLANFANVLWYDNTNIRVPASYQTDLLTSVDIAKLLIVYHALQLNPPQEAPPQNVTRINPVPTGVGRKGVLCASPGCFNEGISQFSDLCRECHARKSGPSRVRNTSVTTAGEASVPLVTPSPTYTSASAAAGTPNYHPTSAPTNGTGLNTCSNPACKNPRRDGRGLCQACENANPIPFITNSGSGLQQLTRSSSMAVTASSVLRHPVPAFTSGSTNTA